MFELLLQAERAMADGSLDEAERTYWQLIENDPANAIAASGLARVFLERGDERLARNFANQALGFDPNCVVATRVLETLEHRTPEPAEPEPPALPLVAAGRLEVVGRQRRTERRSGDRTAQAGAEEDETAEAPQAKPEPDGRSSRRAGPDRVAPRSVAAREPIHPRREPHRAMPIGRRLFEPNELKAQPPDAFSEAEMAAVVEAVDAMDDAGPIEATSAPEAAPDEAEAAEAEALHEAVAVVTGAEGEAAAPEVAAPTIGAAEEPDRAAPETSEEPHSIEEPPAAPTDAAAAPTDAHASAVAQPRKRGWFRRFRRS